MAISERKNELRQPAAIVAFWQVDEIRIVDFGDPEYESGTEPGTIRFDGEDWVPGKLTVSPRSESTEGRESDLTVSVMDPTNSIARALQTVEGLAGERVTVRYIYADEIDDPTQASTQVFVVRAPVITDSGVGFLLGSPAQVEQRTPTKIFSRARCWNRFGLRFEAGNACTYPSDWFTARTRQNFHTLLSSSTEMQWKFGWRTLNANNVSIMRTGYTSPSAFLKLCFEIETFSGAARWLNAFREGPYLYKLITGDFDVETNVSVGTGGTRADYMFGILAQGVSDVTSWIFIAKGEAASVGKIRQRATEASTSTDTDISAGSHRRMRLTRVGDVFTTYARNLSTDAWTQIGTDTITLGSTARVGLFFSGETTATTLGVGRAEHLKFSSGGEATCDRTLTRCRELQNTNDFNGFARMPDVRDRV